jgi:excisionase family DNA binding protein
MATGLTTRQVMERLNVKDPDTVYTLHKRGQIRGGRIGRQYRFDADSVDELIGGKMPAKPSEQSARPSRRRVALPPVRDRFE